MIERDSIRAKESENVRAQSKPAASRDALPRGSGDRRGRARRCCSLCGYKLVVAGHTSGAALTVRCAIARRAREDWLFRKGIPNRRFESGDAGGQT